MANKKIKQKEVKQKRNNKDMFIIQSKIKTTDGEEIWLFEGNNYIADDVMVAIEGQLGVFYEGSGEMRDFVESISFKFTKVSV